MTAPAAPDLHILSLGAGVQSTALLLLAAEGRIPKPTAALFSDTGWEPREVYTHLDRLEAEVAGPAGIPIVRVRYSNLRDDVLGTGRQTGATVPAFTTPMPGRSKGGIVKRQCTEKYKIGPIREWIRLQLGAKVNEKPCTYCAGATVRQVPWLVKRGDVTLYECTPCRGTGTIRRVMVAPRGRRAVQDIGISTDEIQRMRDSRDNYLANSYPLVDDLRWSRTDCITYLASVGWGSTPRSACIGCPYKSNEEWRRLRAGDPAEWADAIDFDRRLREGPARMASGLMDVDAYLHRSLLPLDIAPIDDADDDRPPISCSPVSCAGDDLVLDDIEEITAPVDQGEAA